LTPPPDAADTSDLVFRFGSSPSTIRFVPALRPADVGPPANALLVCDHHTAPLLPAGSPEALCLEAEETDKNWDLVERVIDAAHRAGLDRGARVTALGGGVLCDVVAFAASVYLRGVRLVLIPTTLVAMVDAAVGGKTGIDYEGRKNLIGSFYPAAEVVIWPGALASLPSRQLAAGMAEVVKTALLGDPGLVELLERDGVAAVTGDADAACAVVRRCLQVKGGIVAADPTERTGLRDVLNLGHTFAHALEAVTGFGPWNHGEAVAWGIARAMDLGVHLGETPWEYRARVLALLEALRFRLQVGSQAPPEELVEAMAADKKRRSGQLRFVLQRGVGDTFVRAVDRAEVLHVLTAAGR
jgi:3-dehydroquinate synthase